MRKICLLLLLFIFLFSYKSFATHVRGGQIIVEEIGTGSRQCKVTIRMYLDTESGIPIGGNSDFLYFGDGDKIAVPEIIQGTSIPGAKWIFIDLAGRIALAEYSVMHTYSVYGSYKVGYLEINRNQGIINFSNSVGTPFYTEAQFTLTPGKQYKSPEFLTTPFFRGYVETGFSYSVAATDANDYTLFYRLVTPKSGPGQNVQDYTLPENFKINPCNGLITWDGVYKGHPYVGEFAFAVMVYQIQDNTIIGYNVLDFQIIVFGTDGLSINGKLSDNKGLDENKRIFVPVNTSFSVKILAEDSQNKEITLEVFSALTEKLENISFITYDSVHEDQKIKVGLLTLTNTEDIVRDNPYTLAIRSTFARNSTKETKDFSYLIFSKDTEIELPDMLKGVVSVTEPQSPIKVYPNPVKDFLKLEHINKPNATAALYDLHGKKVAEQNLEKENTTFDMRHVNAGYYLLKISYADGTGKIVRVIKP